MNEFDTLVRELDGTSDKLDAKGILVNIGVERPKVSSPSVASAIKTLPDPEKHLDTYEEMGRVEQVWYSLQSGWHNTVMANKMVDVVDAAESAAVGALSTFIDETSDDVREMLAGNNDVSRAIGEQLKQEAVNKARQYGELVAESENYEPPREITEMAKHVEGMELGEGLVEGLKYLWQGDMVGNAIYLFGSSLSAVAPEFLASGVGGGVLGMASRSTRVANAVRSAVMGMGSARVEYGSTIADQLQKRGVNLRDAQGLVETLEDEATRVELQTKARKRAAVVGSFDTLAAGLASVKLSPSNILRNTSQVATKAPQTIGRRIASEVGNVATQATVQGALGGAGEALGSVAIDDEINPSDVLLEVLGEFTTAPIETGTAIASESFAYVKGKAQATEALEAEKVLNNVSNAVEAIRNDLGNDEAVEAWAARVGQDQTLFSFAQDLIEAGNVERIREINPELAARIETAAEEHQSVEIPVSEMMTIAARDKSLADEIIKDSRTHVDGMTPREAEEFLKNGKDDAMKLFDKIIKRSNSDIRRHKEARQITKGIADQLVQAGTRKEVAEMQVKPWEAYIVNRSKALGMKPQELADLIHLKVKANGDVSGAVPNSFASPMTQGKYWKMGSHVIGRENEHVKVIHASPVDQSDRKQAINKLESILKNGVSNSDTHWLLTGSRSDAKKSLPPFKFKKEVNGLYDAIVNSFENIASNAKLIESHRDVSHNNSSVQGIHIFATAVFYRGEVYRVQLTVRDYIGGGNESRLATHSIDAIEVSVVDDGIGATAPRAPVTTVINQSDTSQSSGARLSNAWPSSNEISLSKLLNGYKREDGAGGFDSVDESAYSEGGVYYNHNILENETTLNSGFKPLTKQALEQRGDVEGTPSKNDDILNLFIRQSDGENSEVRGSYTPGQNLITLMENADKSTFLHESAHAWLDADTMLADSIADKFLAGQELSEGELSLLRNIGGFFRWGQREGVLDLKVRNNDTSIANAVKVWRSMSVQEQTGMHELFAQGFESYLIEGTAPNLEMRTLFQRFAQWLKAVYAHAVNAPKPLSKEVSKLYDLLFISEQEVRDAESRAGLMALFDQDDKIINMTATERKEYDSLNEDAKLEAEGIIRKSVAGVIRTYANIRRSEANRIRIEHKKRFKEVEKQLMTEPRHMVRDVLLNAYDWAKDHRPWKYQFDENILREEGYDQETINSLKKKGFVYQPGKRMRAQLVGTKTIASLFGHPEPAQLVQELLDIEAPIDEATKMVAAEIQMQTGQTFEQYSQLQPDVAAHNRTRSRFLNAEFNALARMLGQKSMLVQAAKEYAANKLDELNVAEVMPYVYVQNEKRCAKMAEKFYRQGKFDHCLEAKRGQIVNFEMARTALTLQEEFEKTVRRTKRAVKSKTLYKPYQSLLIAIAEAHGIAKHHGKLNPLDTNKIKEVVHELEAEGTPVEGIEGVLSDNTSYRNMTVKQARELFAILRELESVARTRETTNLLKEKERIADIVGEGQEKLAEAAEAQKLEPKLHIEVPKTPGDKAKDWLEHLFVGHVKIATYCRIFDRNQDNGFFWNLFIRSANERANFENATREQLTKQLADALLPIFGKKGMFTQGKMRIGNRIMSKGERFAAALNMGNESNLKRLVNGDPGHWSEENIKALQSSLTVEDWQAVQKVWDIFESLRPMIAEKQKRVYGEEPLWIELLSQTIQGSDGQVEIAGGYYPVVYDSRASNRADRQNDVAQTAQAMRGAFQSATTARSFTKQRVDNPDVGPLRLDLTALYNGLNDVVHDLAWHEWLIETRRVLNGVNGDNTGLRQTIKELYGYHVAKAFEQWREGIAQGDRVPSDSFGKPLLRTFAGNVGIASMGFSVTSALIQLTGLGYAIPRCGAKNVLSALTSYLTHPIKARQTINVLSPMMDSRARTMNRQIAEVKNRLESGGVNPFKRYAYSMLIAVQSVVDSIVWLASYRKAMKMENVLNSENPDELAASIADQAVIDTQGSGNVNDLSAVERSDILEPFTVFYSFANTALNHAYSIYRSEENRKSAFAKLLFMGIAMPVAEKLIREAITPDSDDDDQDTEEKVQSLLLTTAGSVTEYHLGMFVGLRELSSGVGNTIAGEHAFNYGGPAGTRGIGALSTLVQKANDPFSWGGANAMIDVAGAFLGLPSVQIKKTIKGIRAIENENVEGIDAMMAPIFGYSGQVK